MLVAPSDNHGGMLSSDHTPDLAASSATSIPQSTTTNQPRRRARGQQFKTVKRDEVLLFRVPSAAARVFVRGVHHEVSRGVLMDFLEHDIGPLYQLVMGKSTVDPAKVAIQQREGRTSNTGVNSGTGFAIAHFYSELDAQEAVRQLRNRRLRGLRLGAAPALSQFNAERSGVQPLPAARSFDLANLFYGFSNWKCEVKSYRVYPVLRSLLDPQLDANISSTSSHVSCHEVQVTITMIPDGVRVFGLGKAYAVQHDDPLPPMPWERSNDNSGSAAPGDGGAHENSATWLDRTVVTHPSKAGKMAICQARARAFNQLALCRLGRNGRVVCVRLSTERARAYFEEESDEEGEA